MATTTTPAAPTDPDLSAVDAQWQAALTALVAAYVAHILPAQRASLLTQIRAVVLARQWRQFAALAVDTAAAGATVGDALRTMAAQAAAQVVADADAAGIEVTARTPDTADLNTTADITTALLGADLAASAGWEAARIAGPDATPTSVADEVSVFLAAQSTATLTLHLGSALTSAQNRARMLTYQAGPVADLFACEVLDSATCEPCRKIDGHHFGETTSDETWVSASAQYPTGQYRNCLGRERCRGTVLAVWHQQQQEAEAA